MFAKEEDADLPHVAHQLEELPSAGFPCWGEKSMLLLSFSVP